MAATCDDQLADRLQLVDDRKLQDVVRMLESTRERGAVEPILAALRPRLRRLRPERPLTVRRLLTVPLEGALASSEDGAWSFVVDRSRLGDLHEAILAGLAPGQQASLVTSLAGRLAHETAAILEHGSTFWPAAAAALARTAAAADEPGAIAALRRRVADLLAIAPALVPLLGRLPRPPLLLDDDEKEVLADILAIALAGSDDRLGTILTLLLRSTRRPAALADDLLAAVEPKVRDRLRPLVTRILDEHRATLDSLLTSVAERPDAAVTQVAETVERVAEAVVDEAGAGAELGRRAGLVAERRYLAAIEDLTSMASVLSGDGQAVREHETAARGVARLGRAAGQLAPGPSIERATGAAVKVLVDAVEKLAEGTAPLAHVRVALLIEILAGPDRAWAHLRLHRG